VHLAACSGATSQKWFYTGAGGEIISQATGRCLDADLGTINFNANKVQTWDCTGAPNQSWSFEFD